MKFNNNLFILFAMLMFVIFLIGCKQQAQGEISQEPKIIEIVDEKIIDEDIEKEFEDDLDEALKELEEIEGIDKKYCEKDADCVAAQCCHAYETINQKYAPNCEGMACTQVCSGPLDCGVGKPVCINNECGIKSLGINQ